MTISTARATARGEPLGSLPPEAYFVVGAVFHYVGPSLAVLLFAYVDVLGVAWLRIAAAAAVFAVWRRPWRTWARLDRRGRRAIVAWGGVLALMNCTFYLAIARLPLGTVAAIEFLPVIALAAGGSRTAHNVAALVIAVVGVSLLTDIVVGGEPLGVAFAFANAALFAAYITLGHRAATDSRAPAIDTLAMAMLVAVVIVTPIAGLNALPALTHPLAVLAGIGIGIASSVIPYVADQLAMARIKRSTFALLLSLMPATATVVGIIVLRQIPTILELVGVALIVAAVGLHRDAEAH